MDKLGTSTQWNIQLRLAPEPPPGDKIGWLQWFLKGLLLGVVILCLAYYLIPAPEFNDPNPTDFKTLIDLGDFHFQIEGPSCDDGVFLLVYVHSAPGHFAKRDTLRRTWANGTLFNDKVRVIFLLGNVGEHLELQAELDRESLEYHDIVQGSFLDTYRNLTYKHVMGLKWTVYRCPNAKFVLKSDDDIFLDPFQLVSDLSQRRPTKDLLSCYVLDKAPAIRDPSIKWFVTEKEYPLLLYPTYCAGWGMVMSQPTVRKLYLVSKAIPYFWVEDVWVSGLLVRRLGVKHVPFQNVASDVEMKSFLNSSSSHYHHHPPPYRFYPPNLNISTIEKLWNRTLMYHLPRSKPFLNSL